MKTNAELDAIINKVGDVLNDSNMTVSDALTVLTVLLAESVVHHEVNPKIVFSNLLMQINGLKEAMEAEDTKPTTPSIILH